MTLVHVLEMIRDTSHAVRETPRAAYDHIDDHHSRQGDGAVGFFGTAFIARSLTQQLPTMRADDSASHGGQGSRSFGLARHVVCGLCLQQRFKLDEHFVAERCSFVVIHPRIRGRARSA